jgi:hypothetical protein
MQQLRIGNVTVDSIIERDGPWRMPADLFPFPQSAYFIRVAQPRRLFDGRLYLQLS